MQGNRLCRIVCGALLVVPAAAQMAGMNHQNFNRAGRYLMNMSSGTAMNPYSWQMPMLMTQAGTWNLMYMAQAFVVDTQQSAPRGGDKFYSVNWFMASALHTVGTGSVALTAMVSLDPLTVTNRRYPLLFQTGETPSGFPWWTHSIRTIFLMGLSVQYARPLDPDTMLQLLLRAGGRSGAGTGGVSAPCVGIRAPAGAPGAPLAGFHAHRKQRRHRCRTPQVVAPGGQRIFWFGAE